MAVHHRVDVGARLVDLGMDEALGIDRALVRPDELAVEAELLDVGRDDKAWRARPRHEETLRIVGMAGADMPVAVDHVLHVEDAVADHQILDHGLEDAVCVGFARAAFARPSPRLLCHL